jgi:hypothetical protein
MSRHEIIKAFHYTQLFIFVNSSLVYDNRYAISFTETATFVAIPHPLKKEAKAKTSFYM